MAATVKNRAGHCDSVKGPYGFCGPFRMKLYNPWCDFLRPEALPV